MLTFSIEFSVVVRETRKIRVQGSHQWPTKVHRCLVFPYAGIAFLLCVLCGNEEAAVASLLDRAASHVEKMPAAESGNHGHDATFAVAVTLVHGFALPEAHVWPILCEFNKRCVPPWREQALRHKLKDARRLTRHSKPRGHLLGAVPVRVSFTPVLLFHGQIHPMGSRYERAIAWPARGPHGQNDRRTQGASRAGR